MFMLVVPEIRAELRGGGTVEVADLLMLEVEEQQI